MHRCLIAALIALPLWPAQLLPATPLPAIRSDFNVPVPMRDGVLLSANIFRPSAPGHYPTILQRTPYNKGNAITATFQAFVNHGYAVMV